MNSTRDGVEHVSDERLLSDFLSGDQAAFASLVERYSTDVFQFVCRFIRNPALAEDVVQETFLQVYQSAGSFDPTRSFRPWLFTIAANKARDQLRSRSRKREVSLTHGSASDDSEESSFLDFMSDDDATPSEAVEQGERRAAVRKVVSHMPDNLREVLILGYFHRFPYKEISEILDVPLGTVKSRLHAAVSWFAEAYKRGEQEEGTRESERSSRRS